MGNMHAPRTFGSASSQSRMTVHALTSSEAVLWLSWNVNELQAVHILTDGRGTSEINLGLTHDCALSYA